MVFHVADGVHIDEHRQITLVRLEDGDDGIVLVVVRAQARLGPRLFDFAELDIGVHGVTVRKPAAAAPARPPD